MSIAVMCFIKYGLHTWFAYSICGRTRDLKTLEKHLSYRYSKGIMSALGRPAYLDQSNIIKQGCSSQGSYCVNDLWMIDYPVGWAPGGGGGGGGVS